MPRKAQTIHDFADLIGALPQDPDPKPRPDDDGDQPDPAPDEPEDAVLEPDEIVPPPKVTARRSEFPNVVYESRIRVLDAWQYHGNVPHDAPGWIDRNWIGWADVDTVRNVEAGPCLRVPLLTGDIAVCRVGDYVARQEVLMLAEFPGDIRLEVWPQAQFEKLFLPVGDNPMEQAR